MYNDYLIHTGKLGMKWGKRTARGHAGPGASITKKRQDEMNKSDIKTLDNGGHLSVGATKSRQAAYDKRDRANIENKSKQKAEKEQFKADVKALTKGGLSADFNNHGVITQFYNTKNQKVGKEYMDKVEKKSDQNQTVKALAFTSAVIAGPAIVANIISRINY